MADTQVKRSIPAAQPKRRRLDHHVKLRGFEALYHLNRGFNITAFNFERLERLGLMRPRDLRAFRHMSEEVRALANSDLLLILEERETEDAVRFQKLRLKWQKRLKEPRGRTTKGTKVRNKE